jgi:hypothetical protein
MLSYTALSTNEFLAKKSILVLEHPTYSQDLTPCGCFPSPTMKNHLKRSYFETMEEIQKVTTATLNILEKNDF